MDKRFAKHTLNLLRKWVENPEEVKYPSHGICANILDTVGYYSGRHRDHEDLYRMMLDWEHFSGDEDYPVPPPEDSPYKDAEGVYSCDLGHWTGSYGELRIDLCKHLIKKLEKLV